MQYQREQKESCPSMDMKEDVVQETPMAKEEKVAKSSHIKFDDEEEEKQVKKPLMHIKFDDDEEDEIPSSDRKQRHSKRRKLEGGGHTSNQL
jgi:hypothetical protein